MPRHEDYSLSIRPEDYATLEASAKAVSESLRSGSNKQETDLAWRVIHQSQCQACQGYGVIQHPIWAEFWEPFEGRMSTSDLSNWRARQLGYGRLADMPPEEIECPDCEGSGYARREVPLVEALRELGVLGCP